MKQRVRRAHAVAPWIAILFSVSVAVGLAQKGSLAVMFNDDQRRDVSLAPSFLQVDLPATATAAFPARLYLSAGDLERAFDRREYRPDAVIIPTNTDLRLTATAPATQRVLIARVQKQAGVMQDLEEQVATRRKASSPSSEEMGVLRIGVDAFVAQLPRRADVKDSTGAFPRAACFIATDFPDGGAIDRRELFAQDRVRKGVAECLATLDAAGAQTLVVPLMGAASAGTQTNDAMFEGQRTLMECRHINATAGIALGIHDFAARRRNLREIGLVQWDLGTDQNVQGADRQRRREIRSGCIPLNPNRSSRLSARDSLATRRRRAM